MPTSALVPAAGDSRALTTADLMDSLATFLRLNVAEGDASEHTIEGYLIHVRQFYEWCLASGIEAGLATERDVAQYRRHMVEEGYKRSTITVKLAAIRRFYQAAVWRGFRPDNPAEGLKAPRSHTSRRDHILERYLSPEEVASLLNAPDRTTDAGVRDWAMIGYMYFHGLRVSEIVGLRVQHARLDNMQIQVRGGKGGRDRVVPMVETTARMTRDWMEARSRVVTRKSNHALFLSLSNRNQGGPLSVNGARYILNQYLKRAGIKRPGVSCHALRHAHASHFIEQGGDIVTLSHELGHASVETTGVYTHVVDAIRQNPAAKLEEAQDNL